MNSMGTEHLCKSCVFTRPIKVGESCGNGYLYLESKVACVGYEKDSAKPYFDDSNKCDSVDYGGSTFDMSDASSSDLYFDDNDSSVISIDQPKYHPIEEWKCARCGEVGIGKPWGMHIYGDEDYDEFHLHRDCLKALWVHLIKLESE